MGYLQHSNQNDKFQTKMFGAAPSGSPPAGVIGYGGYQDPAAQYAQPVALGGPQAAYYPQASAGYAYGYQYPYPQEYGYSYGGYQQ